MVDGNIISEFIDALKTEPKETQSKLEAIVSRIDNEGVVWVNVAGSEVETPTASISAEVKEGDAVTVEHRNNRLYIAGNYSNPAAGSTRVANVETAARTANEAANNAVADAGRARDAAYSAEETAKGVEGIAKHAEEVAERVENTAQDAQASADQANQYAISALQNLSNVEKVVDAVNWISEHGSYLITEDQNIMPTHVYYELNDSQATYKLTADTSLDLHKQYFILEDGVYTPVKKSQEAVENIALYYEILNGSWGSVEKPVAENIYKYYQLDISQGVSNYVASHLALTDDGLFLTADNSKYRLLLAVDGMRVTDPTGNVVGLHGETIRLGKESEIHFEATSNRLKFCTRDENICWFNQNTDGI